MADRRTDLDYRAVVPKGRHDALADGSLQALGIANR